MNSVPVVFSPQAQQRLAEIADYLYQQHLSNAFVIDYLNKIESWLQTVLGQFPESGQAMPAFGSDIRRVVYRRYSFIYRYHNDVVEILTIYRENRP